MKQWVVSQHFPNLFVYGDMPNASQLCAVNGDASWVWFAAYRKPLQIGSKRQGEESPR